MGFPGGSEVKASASNAGNPGSIPGLGRSPGEGNGNPLQYSCLENPMDGGAWQATVHGVAKTGTWLNDLTSLDFNIINLFTFNFQKHPFSPPGLNNLHNILCIYCLNLLNSKWTLVFRVSEHHNSLKHRPSPCLFSQCLKQWILVG